MAKSKRPRTADHRVGLREELLDVGLKLFMDGEDPSMAQVGESIDVTKGSVYWYWASKKSFLADMMEHWYKSKVKLINKKYRDIFALEIVIKWSLDNIQPMYRELLHLTKVGRDRCEYYGLKLHEYVAEHVLEPAWGEHRPGHPTAAMADAFHTWLMGLAYVEGIDYQSVRINGRADVALLFFDK
jgi:AcrR family transcriptional regulator